MAKGQRQALEEWKLRIEGSRRNTENLRREWWRYFLLYIEGDWIHRSDQIDFDRDHISVNLAFSHVKTMLPRLFFKKPKIFSPPRKKEDIEEAMVASAYLNYLWETLPLKKETKLAILDALLFGVGIMKVGFHSRDLREWEELTEKAEEFEKEAIEDLQREQIFRELGISQVRETRQVPPNRFRAKRDQRIDYDDEIVPELPWAKRISPFNFYVDPLGNQVDNIRWMAHRYVLALEDAQQNTVWGKSARNKLQAQRIALGSENASTFDGAEGDGDRTFLNALERGNPFNIINSPIDEKFFPEPLKKPELGQVEIWEVWDKKTNEVWVINEIVDEPLLVMANPFKSLDGFPFEVLSFNDVPDSFWPMSDFRATENQIMEISQLRTQALEHIKRSTNTKIGLKKGSIDETNQRRMESSSMAVMVEIDEADDVRRAVQPLNLGTLDTNIYTAGALLKADFDEISGISEQQRGVRGADTATESAILERNASLRLDERQDQILDFVESFTGKLFRISTQFVLPGFQIRTLGEKGFLWRKVTPASLDPNREVKVEVGSTVKQDDDVKRRRLVETLNVLVPLMVQGLVRVDIQEMVRQFIEAQEVFADVDRFLNPTAAQLEEQLGFVNALRGAGASGDQNSANNQAANAGQANDPGTIAGIESLFQEQNQSPFGNLGGG